MPLHVYQRIILFLDPEAGQSVTRVFALSRIFKEITPRSAQIMLGLATAPELPDFLTSAAYDDL